MLQESPVRLKSGFRSLTGPELVAVCGGLDIVVTGNVIVVTGPRSGGLSGIDLIGFQNMQQEAGLQMMIDMMEGTTEQAPPVDETPVGLWNNDIDDFKAFAESNFPSQENQIMVVGEIGGQKFAANIGPNGSGYLWVVTDNFFTSDTYELFSYVENAKLGFTSGNTTTGSSAFTVTLGSSTGGAVTFDITTDAPGW